MYFMKKDSLAGSSIQRLPTHSSIFIKMLFLLLCLGQIGIAHAAKSVRIQFMDLGQADGIVIRTPNNHWIVIDAGTNDRLLGYLGDMGVKKLDLAVVTHRHADHQGGMDDILNSVPTDLFVGSTDDCPNQKGDDMVREALSDNSIEAHKFSETPEKLNIDGVKFTLIPLPPTQDCPGQENSNSIVVRMDYGKFSVLFTGDAEEDELQWLVQNHEDLLDVDILKASHHGSNNGYTEEFLSLVSPDKVVISAGVNGKYKHPMKEAVDAYISVSNNHVYCTNRHGTIRMYGYKDGRVNVAKQRDIEKSCVYDGTHY